MSAPRGKVLLAMSGGVDSSVAAALLLREGYEVVGVFMRLGSPGEAVGEPAACGVEEREAGSPSPGVRIGKQGCCSINDAADARLVAAHLGIPFYVVNFKKDFGRIIDYFTAEYAAGRTPNPCVRCNDWLKFGRLHQYAEQLGAPWVASGHYARIRHRGARAPRHGEGTAAVDGDSGALRASLLRGVDADKDQSYVLFGVPRGRLDRMLLPVGGYTKPEIRALAEEMGLPVFDKPDSQEICFVPDNDYAGLLERRRPELRGEGAIVDPAGNVVGAHSGHHRFTIGQRRGVGVAFGHPIYVVDKDPASNTITVGDSADLMCTSCTAGEANWLVERRDGDATAPRRPGGRGRSGSFAVLAQHRYNSRAVPATVEALADAAGDTPSGRAGRFRVVFDEPQRAVAPGQAVVLYDAEAPDLVLGGGWIEGTERGG